MSKTARGTSKKERRASKQEKIKKGHTEVKQASKGGSEQERMQARTHARTQQMWGMNFPSGFSGKQARGASTQERTRESAPARKQANKEGKQTRK